MSKNDTIGSSLIILTLLGMEDARQKREASREQAEANEVYKVDRLLKWINTFERQAIEDPNIRVTAFRAIDREMVIEQEGLTTGGFRKTENKLLAQQVADQLRREKEKATAGLTQENVDGIKALVVVNKYGEGWRRSIISRLLSQRNLDEEGAAGKIFRCARRNIGWGFLGCFVLPMVIVRGGDNTIFTLLNIGKVVFTLIIIRMLWRCIRLGLNNKHWREEREAILANGAPGEWVDSFNRNAVEAAKEFNTHLAWAKDYAKSQHLIISDWPEPLVLPEFHPDQWDKR